MPNKVDPESGKKSECVLREEEQRVFQFHWLCFLYLPWPMPIKWNKSFTAVIEVKPRWKWTIWRLNVMCMFSLGLCCLVMIPYFVLRPRPEVKTSNLVTMFTFGVFACYVALTLWFFPKLLGELLTVLNGVYRLSMEFGKKYGSHMAHGGALDENVGTFLAAIIVVVAPMPFIGTFVGLSINLDVTYWVLDEFFMPKKEYWGWDMIILELIIRSLVLSISINECVRTGSYCICLVLIGVNRFQSMMHAMLSYSLPTKEFLRYYKQILIYYKMIITPLELQFYCLLMMTFWMAVISICAIVKLHDSLSPTLILIAIFLGTLSILGNAIAIPLACKITTKLVGLLVINVKRAEFRQAKRNTFQTKVNLKACHALQLMTLRYGRFMYVDKDFQSNYMMMFFDRCTDALLSIDGNMNIS